MRTLEEFEKLTPVSLKTLLAENRIFYPQHIHDNILLDYAKNRLHGIEFLYDNEEMKNGKITLKIKTAPKPKEGESCPNCLQKQLRELNVPESHQYHKTKHCSYCGLYLTPEEQKQVAKQNELADKKESETSKPDTKKKGVEN